MRLKLVLLILAVACPVTSAEPPRLAIHVVDFECHPLPGVPVSFYRGGKSAGRPELSTVTDSSGDAFLSVVMGQRYEAVASLPNCIPVRIGPFVATQDRLTRPVLVLLDLKYDWTVVLPTPAPGSNLMDKH